MTRGIVAALLATLAVPAAASADQDVRGLWRAAPLTIRIAEFGQGTKGSVVQGLTAGGCSVATGEQVYIIDKTLPVHSGTAFVYRVVDGKCEKKLGEARFLIRGGASFDVLRVCVKDPFNPNDPTDIDAEITRAPSNPAGLNGLGVGSAGCYELGRQASQSDETKQRTASDYFGKFERRRCLAVGPTSFYLRIKKVLADPFLRVVKLTFNGKTPEIYTGPTNGVIRLDAIPKGSNRIRITIRTRGGKQYTRERKLPCAG